MAVRKIKLTIQYDGYAYSGWQTQPGYRTIQETLNKAVSSLVGRDITVHGASRTDAGVSALGQAGLIELVNCPIPTKNFPKAITDRLPPEIVVTDAVEVDKKFDLLGDVKSKLYRYTICNQLHRSVMDVRHCWHVHKNLDEKAMKEAAALIVGTKDFKSFASAADRRKSTLRTIFRCEVEKKEGWFYIDVEGKSFLYNMVRNIVGTLIEVALGRLQPEKITAIIEAKDRTAAGQIAPPQGLCLLWIKY